MTKVVLSIGTKSGVEKVPGSPAKIINLIESQYERFLRFIQDGFSAQVALHHLDLSLRLLDPMHWLELEEFG